MIAIDRTRTPADWEACKAIRFEVFVDEQQVPPELELDEHDEAARHWLAREGGQPLGTARVVELPDAWKVGRVAVLAKARGKGVGKALLRHIEGEAREAGARKLVLESQVHAIPFYEGLGYAAHGPEFMDAGIPHRKMTLALDQDL